MARTILCTQQKGGAGKTTLAVHLAAVLAERGRVLLLDCDGQFDSFRFFTGQEPQERSLTRALAHPRLSVLWNPERTSLRKLVAPESYDFVIIDMDTPLDHLAQLIRHSQPDHVLVPVNPQTLTLTHMPTVLEAVHKLGAIAGPTSSVTIVPLGRSYEETFARMQAAPHRPPSCTVAPAVRNLFNETADALESGTLIWDVQGCEDLRPYFEQLAASLR